MTEQQKVNEIISLMTFLQRFIQNHINQSFTDLSFDLETFIKDFLNVFEKDGEKYENINYIKHNYPAIDLVNEKRSIAVQVTTNADLRKVRKTIDTFSKHKLPYSSLIIIGFVKATHSSLPNVKIHNIDYLIELAKHSNNEQKNEIYNILHRRIPWNSLTPMDDKHCFDIVFDVINRSAIRDFTLCEGDFDRMVDGLTDIKEIITTGKIKGKDIRAKALVEYTDKVRTKLSEIEFLVSRILQICNLNKNSRSSDFLCLSRQETDDIDQLKDEIINKSNDMASNFNLTKKIIGSRR
jgi:hypothetical protein